MIVARRFEVIAILLFFATVVYCQNTKLITFKKEHSFAFFQQGEKKDTISQNKGNLFFLQVPGKLTPNLIISVENAKLENISGDTLLRLIYVKGHKYESFFSKEENAKGEDLYKFTTAVNGASSIPEKEILITFYDTRKPEMIMLKNRFIFVKQ